MTQTTDLNKIEFIREEPVLITFSLNHNALSWLERIFLKAGIIKGKKTYAIHSCTMATTAALSKLLLSIGIQDLNLETPVDRYYEIVHQHRSTVLRIIAVGIRNWGPKYSHSVERLIDKHLTTDEIIATLFVVQKQMHVQHFIAAIMNLRGLNMLETKTRQIHSENHQNELV